MQKIREIIQKARAVFEANYKIQHVVMLAFSLIILGIVSFALLIAYRFTVEEVHSVSADYVSQLIAQVNGEIDRYVVYMDDVSDVVSRDASVLQWLREGEKLGLARRMVLEDSIHQRMSSIVNIRKDITNIGIFGTGDRVVFDSRHKGLNPYAEYADTDWYREISSGNQSTYITTSYVQNVVDKRFDWVVTMSKPLKNQQSYLEGILMIDLNYNVINNLCKSVDMGDRGYIYVIDSEGNIIYHPKQQLIYSHIVSELTTKEFGDNQQRVVDTKDGAQLYISNHSQRTGWTVVGVAYEDELLQSQSNIVAFYIAILIFFFIMAIILSAIISSVMTKPFKRLTDGMQAVETGSLNTHIDTGGPVEMAQLGRAFNSMTSQLKTLVDQREQDQTLRRESEMKALQAQINPHFLYNTLDSIIWMAEDKDYEAVVEMTSALSWLLRYSVSETRELVSLQAEIAHIRSYLTIQQMRYKENLHFKIEIPSEMTGYLLPKLLLQPLVENAIYHGIKPKVGGGEVVVRGYQDENYFVLEIADDGVGMDEGRLKDILKEDANHKSTGSGIGVRNVDGRIKLIYGEQYGLKFESRQGEGTVAKVLLPRIEGVED